MIVEGSQGTPLSLGFSQHYPYCTSGNCTSTAALDDVGLNWRRVDEFRPYGGIRVEDNVACTAAAPENLTRDAFAALA